jgi:hypothetical protein
MATDLSKKLSLQTPRSWEEMEHVFAQLQTWLSSVRVAPQPIARVRLNATQAITNNTSTDVVWAIPAQQTAYEYDTTGILRPSSSGGTSGTLFLPNEDGLYLLITQIRWAAAGATTGVRQLILDGFDDEIAIDAKDGSTTAITQQLVSLYQFPCPLNARHPWDWEVFQTSGGDLDISRTANSGWAQVIKIS